MCVVKHILISSDNELEVIFFKRKFRQLHNYKQNVHELNWIKLVVNSAKILLLLTS